MGSAAPLVLFVVFLAGILFDSGHESQVILLSDADGKVGAVEVVSAGGRMLLDEVGQMTKVSGSSAPSAPQVLDLATIEKEFSPVLSVEPPQPAKFLLYFEQGSIRLTTVSEELLPQVYREIEKRNSAAIGIYGHSDRTGSDEYNLELSTRRAMAVRKLLADEGIDLKNLDVNSHGEGNPLIPTSDGVAEPRNRRVEVIVR